MPHAMTLPNSLQLNIPIKEEMEDDLDFPDNNIPSLSGENGSETESEEGQEENTDIICSLFDTYYKAALEEHYEAIAKMKREGIHHNINANVGALMNQFEAKRQKGNGRFLKYWGRGSSSPLVEIDEAAAREKIYADLSRESNNVNKKRHKESESSSKSTGAKRSKTISRDATASGYSTAASSENMSTRTRAVSQLKAMTKEAPYTEHWLPDSHTNGTRVDRYSKKTNYKALLKSAKTTQEKFLCAGQAFAKELNDLPDWYVKACSSDEERSNFVTYKGCHHSCSNELEAKEGGNSEGVGKFTGYESLAKHVYSQDRMVEELTKKSKELKDILHLLGLPLKTATLSSDSPTKAAANEEETNHDMSDNSNDTPHTFQASTASPTTATTSNNSTQTLESNVAPENANPAIKDLSHNHDILIAKRNELKEVQKHVSNKLSTAGSKCISADETWKHDNTINFYNTLNEWLIRMAWEIENFSSADIQRDIDEFESCMANLEAAEENGNEVDVEFQKALVGSWVKKVKEKRLPSST